MRTEAVTFPSGGSKLAAALYKPEGPGPFPVVVMAGGWCYVKELAQPGYAREFVKHGLAALIFDYANFGASEGEPRQHIDPWQQIENYRDAISYVETRDDVISDRVGVWGISYSGGHVIILAAIDPRIRCAVSNVPVVNGYNAMRLTHGSLRFRELSQLIADDRRKRFQTGEWGYLPMSSETPYDELSTWPLPEVYPPFVAWKSTEAPNHEHRSTIASVDHLLAYDVEPYARRIVNVPTLMTVAEGDDITQWSEEQAVFNLIPNPDKRFSVLADTSHMRLYSDKSSLQVAAEQHREWFVSHLITPFE